MNNISDFVVLPINVRLARNYYSSNINNYITITADNNIQTSTYTIPRRNEKGVLYNDGMGKLSWGPVNTIDSVLNITNSNIDGTLKINQLGGGDSAIRFYAGGEYYTIGLDNSAASFRITHGADMNYADTLIYNSNALRVNFNNANTNGILHLYQGGIGDASIHLETTGQQYILGIDKTDSNFKISRGTTLGDSDVIKLGRHGATILGDLLLPAGNMCINNGLFVPAKKSVAPESSSLGGIYFDTNINKLKIWTGVTWETITSL